MYVGSQLRHYVFVLVQFKKDMRCLLGIDIGLK